MKRGSQIVWPVGEIAVSCLRVPDVVFCAMELILKIGDLVAVPAASVSAFFVTNFRCPLSSWIFRVFSQMVSV
jgi:hypothetical protein